MPHSSLRRLQQLLSPLFVSATVLILWPWQQRSPRHQASLLRIHLSVSGAFLSLGPTLQRFSGVMLAKVKISLALWCLQLLSALSLTVFTACRTLVAVQRCARYPAALCGQECGLRSFGELGIALPVPLPK